MKKLLGVLVLAMGLCLFNVPASYADHDHDYDHDKGGCKEHDKDCDHDKDHDGNGNNTSVPEPGSLGLLTAGIVVVGGAVVMLNRKRRLSN